MDQQHQQIKALALAHEKKTTIFACMGIYIQKLKKRQTILVAVPVCRGLFILQNICLET